MLRFPGLILLLLASSYACAQVPYTTILDTAEMKKIRDKKIKYEYDIRVPFDSVTGNLTKGAKPDTTYSLYDRMGREIDFSYLDDDGERQHNYVFFNPKGQAYREMSVNDDSTDGFVDYWKYNDRGQVISEISYERVGKKEIPFSATEFIYDESGRLKTQRDYIINDDGSKEKDGSVAYTYSKGYTIRYGIGLKGDTQYVDSSIHADSEGDYWSRRYIYTKTSSGKFKKRMVSFTESRTVNLGSRNRSTILSRYYDYQTGKLEQEYIDTSYSDRNDNLLETRDPAGYEKFIYDDRGKLEYSIRYNRANQPLMRRTEVFVYYE